MTNRLAKLQFLGPTAVLFGVGAAEGAAWGLAHSPASETLWYVNLRIFGIFQQGNYALSSVLLFPYLQLFLIALPLFAIAAYGFFARRTFLLAIASNLSFVYTGFLFYVGLSGQPHALAASLTSIAVSTGPNIYMPIALVTASLISFLVSHFQYLLKVVYSTSIPQA
jgi:hypothetical protein